MPVLSLAALLRTHKHGFLQSYSGAPRPHPSSQSAGHHSRVEKAPPPEVSPSRHLQVPAPDTALMFAAGEELSLRARRLDQPLSILILHLHDLPELELVFGSHAAEEVVDEAMTQLMAIAGDKGFAARTASDMFTLLMPMQAEVMVKAIQARLGKPCCIDFEFEGQDILLVPELMVRTVDATESVRDTYWRLCQDVAYAHCEKHRPQRKARCEHESRTAPAERRPTPIVEKDIPTFFPPLPATIPVPLYSR
jgi:GGDEF domain-containing protein